MKLARVAPGLLAAAAAATLAFGALAQPMQPHLSPRQTVQIPGQRRAPPIPPGHERFPHGARLPGAHGAPAHARPAAAEPEEAPHPDEEHCPGRGPDDPPPPVNWWHGMLMANNERALKGDFVDRLLFRYESDENPCDERNEPPPFAAAVLNFGILCFILYRYGKKPLADALVKRRQSIMAEIENATRLKNEAEERLADYEEKFENIHEKLEALRAEYAAQSEAERKHILEEAEERRTRMRRDAEFRIEQELKTARVELLREAVEGSVAAAEKLLRARLQPSDHERIADEYLATLGAAMASAGAAEALGHGGAR
ncbi:MAG TPA: ATP synthase F0 subunit B [Minicystis sp.]|nr:ATP synthase F0 subunit B [Minicystis sp.]